MVRLTRALYWTIGTYETDWDGFEYGNVCYATPMTADAPVVTNNNYGGSTSSWEHQLPHRYLRQGGDWSALRYQPAPCALQRCALLRAAECENEVNGPTQQAIDWINQFVGVPVWPT